MLGQSNKKVASTKLRRALRRNPTDAERRLWQVLRGKQLRSHKFRRQHPFGDFILDFVCLESRLIIEVDGGQHAEQMLADRARTEHLQRAGFRVLRFWDNEVLGQPDVVGERIWCELGDNGTTAATGETKRNPIPTPTLPLKGRESNAPQPAGRAIRSYVLRQGRMSVAQKRAYDSLLERYAIPFSLQPLDLSQPFGREAPKILEIGFGMGETTARIAASHPERDYLGVEVHSPGVGSLLKLIDEQQLGNVRVVQHDAAEVVEHMIAPGALAAVHVFFPDPWPKKRHHKRRLIQPPFVRLLASRLAVGGYLHLATDWQEYAQQMLEVLGAEPLLRNTARDYAPRPEYRPLTKFEQRGLKLGHGVWDLVFDRA